jgi:hypothetical protein
MQALTRRRSDNPMARHGTSSMGMSKLEPSASVPASRMAAKRYSRGCGISNSRPRLTFNYVVCVRAQSAH